MVAGRLAAVNPAATTNTLLYRAAIEDTASAVVNVCNQNASAGTFRMAVRDYDQVLHLDGLNASAYKFAKGNPVTGYYLDISPGFQDADAIPGTNITTTAGATATLLDVFKPTEDVTYYAKVAEILTISYEADTLAGTENAGETVTGATSGLTATFRGSLATVGSGSYMSIADVASGATAVNVDRNTGLADGMYLTIGDTTETTNTDEIVSIDASGINTTTNVLTITRGALGTTAAAIPAGVLTTAWSASATVTTINEGATYAAGDITLTLTDSTGFVTGGFILVDNEIMEISGVAGNDLTVTRGSFGTADVDHNNGVNVTLLTNNGQYLLNFFTADETLNFAGGATADISFSATASQTIDTKYIFSTTSAVATDHIYSQTISLDVDRTYIFDQSDASTTGYDLRFSDDAAEGPNGTPAGTEYTTGVVKTGLAGTNGITQIAITDQTSNLLNIYADQVTEVGLTANVQLQPTYGRIYIYNVGGEALAAADTFTIGGVTQTIQQGGVNVGPYGYVHDWDPALNHLKVSTDTGSQAFAVGDQFYDSPTLINGTRSLVEVVDGKILTVTSIGAADASRSAGTYTVSGTSAGSGVNQSFEIVVDGSGAATITILNGGKNHTASDTITVLDSQLGGGGAANLTFDVGTISSGLQTGATGVYSVADWIYYDEDLAATTATKVTGVVVGPGQNLLVQASNADTSFVVNGFESASADYDVINMGKATIDEGGGAPVP
jgi:hypothetical protein